LPIIPLAVALAVAFAVRPITGNLDWKCDAGLLGSTIKVTPGAQKACFDNGTIFYSIDIVNFIASL